MVADVKNLSDEVYKHLPVNNQLKLTIPGDKKFNLRKSALNQASI